MLLALVNLLIRDITFFSKLKAAADAKAAALAKDIKAGEAVVVKAQADLEASINVCLLEVN